jgi:hypothetical protein
VLGLGLVIRLEGEEVLWLAFVALVTVLLRCRRGGMALDDGSRLESWSVSVGWKES